MLVEFTLGVVLKEYTPKSVVTPITAMIAYCPYDTKYIYTSASAINGTMGNVPYVLVEHLEDIAPGVLLSAGRKEKDYADLFWELEWTGYCFKCKMKDPKQTFPALLITSNDAWVDRDVWEQITTRTFIDSINEITEVPDHV